MTDKERLTNIIDDYTECLTVNDLHCLEFADKFADYLLANGVIVPPCKVGDNIYFPWIYGGTLGVAILEVYSIKMYVQGKPLVFIKDPESDMAIPNAFAVDDFGKTVFLTREEAEKVLERSK